MEAHDLQYTAVALCAGAAIFTSSVLALLTWFAISTTVKAVKRKPRFICAKHARSLKRGQVAFLCEERCIKCVGK